jgi:hypothetical protein
LEKISKLLGEKTFDYEIRGYAHQEIKKMLDVADVKYFTSGDMRREALAQVTEKEMSYLEQYKIYKIKIYRKTASKQALP